MHILPYFKFNVQTLRNQSWSLLLIEKANFWKDSGNSFPTKPASWKSKVKAQLLGYLFCTLSSVLKLRAKQWFLHPNYLRPPPWNSTDKKLSMLPRKQRLLVSARCYIHFHNWPAHLLRNPSLFYPVTPMCDYWPGDSFCLFWSLYMSLLDLW